MTSQEIAKQLSEYKWVNWDGVSRKPKDTLYYRFGMSVMKNDTYYPRASISTGGTMSIWYPAKGSRLYFDDIEKFRKAILKEQKLLKFK